MRAKSKFLLLTALQFGATATAMASSFSATPMNVEIHAPGSTSTVTIKNDGDQALTTQIRVFRWSQVNGVEKLEPTTDVVASPPMGNVAAKSEQVIRLVRVSKKLVDAEESYRVFVDEVPDLARRKSGQVGIAVRYSIPAFIIPPAAASSQVSWALERAGDVTAIVATNTGGRRVKVSALTLKDSAGKAVSFGEGLNGYVLARSSMRWVIPGNAPKLSLNGPVTVTARGDDGPINAQAKASPAR
jgi:fimbrial chaperone protein